MSKIFEENQRGVAELHKTNDPMGPRRLQLQLCNHFALLNARPYRGCWFLFTATPKGKRRDPLYVYENLFRDIIPVKSIDHLVVTKEKSQTGVYHFHGFLHSKSHSKFMKLQKSKTMSYLIHPMYTGYDYHYWYDYILKDRPPFFTLYSSKKGFRTLRFGP